VESLYEFDGLQKSRPKGVKYYGVSALTGLHYPEHDLAQIQVPVCAE
jgi:hypothetical protein